MTMPMNYVQASQDFEAFMADFMECAGLPTHHRAYHSIRAVLRVFRNHLTLGDALKFADVLPPVLRAIFVEGWLPDNNPEPFPDRQALYREIGQIRKDHNLAPETVIADAAGALRRHIDNPALDRVLEKMPPGAANFWSARPAD